MDHSTIKKNEQPPVFPWHGRVARSKRKRKVKRSEPQELPSAPSSKFQKSVRIPPPSSWTFDLNLLLFPLIDQSLYRGRRRRRRWLCLQAGIVGLPHRTPLLQLVPTTRSSTKKQTLSHRAREKEMEAWNGSSPSSLWQFSDTWAPLQTSSMIVMRSSITGNPFTSSSTNPASKHGNTGEKTESLL